MLHRAAPEIHAGPEADALIAAFADSSPAPLASHDIAVVVAHPDDETLGCGAQLTRMPAARVVVATDGAPRTPIAAATHGFETADAYAAARAGELAEALAIAGVSAHRLTLLGIPDQQAALDLPALARRLAAFVLAHGIRVVLTHAYEGGHPDHDAVAFATHAAAALAEHRGRSVAIIEMPLYRLGPDGWLRRSFSSEAGHCGIAVTLSADAVMSKRQMIAAHATQRATLADFPLDTECFRRSPGHDFAVLPNRGRLLYEQYDWGLTGAGWRDLVTAACAELGLSTLL